MKFIVLGISHKTAPIALRENFYLSEAERELLLAELKAEPRVAEAMVISTCNRIEIYAVTLDGRTGVLLRALLKIKKINCPRSFVEDHFFQYHDDKAVRHLFTVVCGLDSLVLGEKQIVGQIKAAIELSRRHKMLGRFMNILLNITLRTGKKARTETRIGCGGSSVSWAAVQEAERYWGTLQDRSILVVGAGKMSKLAAGDLKRRGIRHLYLMNRTPEKALELAQQFNAEVVPFWEIREALNRVDVCICSAGAPHYLIEPDLIRAVVKARAGRPLVLIDISMPRNIHPDVAAIPGVLLSSLDQLETVVEETREERLSAVYDVEKIITEKIEEFYRKLAGTARHRTRVHLN